MKTEAKELIQEGLKLFSLYRSDFVLSITITGLPALAKASRNPNARSKNIPFALARV